MTIETIDINANFNVLKTPRPWTRFSPNDEPADDRTVFDEITYRCTCCDYCVSFKDADFRKHSQAHFSNLSASDDESLKEFAAAHQLLQQSFLDFYCPDCKTPTRIYFSDGGGGKGDYLVRITSELAIKNND